MPVSARTRHPRRCARLVLGLAVLTALGAAPAPATAAPPDRPVAVMVVRAAPASPAPAAVPASEVDVRPVVVPIPDGSTVAPARVAVRAPGRRAPPA